LIDALLEFIEEIGGLEPLAVPTKPKSTGVTGGSGSADGSLSANMRAALDVIALGEVGEDGGYNTQFGGGTFSSFEQHPNISDDLKPAGRYQFQYRTWKGVAEEEGLTDFSPQSQDKGAVNRIKSRGAADAVEAGDFEAALTGTGGLTGIAYEWAAMPPSRYGQSKLSMAEALEAFERFKRKYAPGAEEKESATESVSAAATPAPSTQRAAALVGQQISLELGLNGVAIIALSFLHTSLDFSLYESSIVGFGGQSAAWVLTQRVRNTAYTNVTFKQIAQKICDAYGLTLDMPNDGAKYEYFPQRGLTDYQSLLIEARRIGYRMTCKGNTLTIKPRGAVEAFTVIRGENLGDSFTLSHEAQGSSSGGARSSDPSAKTTTGQRKVKIDPDTGKQEIIKPENLVGAGVSPEASTTGAAVTTPAPSTTGETDAADATRKDNEARIKGLEASFTMRTSADVLTLDPDSAIATEGISPQLDRLWVIDTLTHSLSSSGFSSDFSVYSPMKNKYPEPKEQAGSGFSGEVPPLNPGGFIVPTSGTFTSPYGPRWGRHHDGVDIADSLGAAVWAAADGVVTFTHTSCPYSAKEGCGSPPYSGYGNTVAIQHDEGYLTFYAHLGDVTVSEGDTVTQGQKIGTQADSGSSGGIHLHFGATKDGASINPATIIELPGKGQKV
jgi:murein DD-endopeptidase MepM/ murein hydrolase activator NlpD/muramidase (phage lysozyme)